MRRQLNIWITEETYVALVERAGALPVTAWVRDKVILPMLGIPAKRAPTAEYPDDPMRQRLSVTAGQYFARKAFERDMPQRELYRRVLQTVADHDLINAVLDDGESA